ncbi:plasmid pRiA4b ORF-3 family protein [Salmonella enterica]|nr:hypothetical protein [Salmonella enterica]EBH8334036.1 hypothetical protein [Salmonella enterica subsp. houtenae serovar Houten]ECE6699842.1 hypothetical protein [Salmonella enterica subsp. houtenae]EDU9921493.1 plasmid pRiA4b ORF-3 family protein [Salmonella enterica subsp. enterica]EAO2080818.1 hypothetical protein [Salmonella enterica]
MGDFAFDGGDRFTYEYNFFEHWLHDVRVEAIHKDSTLKSKRPARTVLTGMCYSVGSATRQGSSSFTRLTGQSAMTLST